MFGDADRFWGRVAKGEGCWIWMGSRHRGYGRFRPPGERPVRAHRFAWEQTFGPIPAGQSVLHRCDVPSCVRPEHLFLGTQAENMADMRTKGRASDTSGVRNGRAKLTPAQVQSVRASRARGERAVVLAAEYGVCARTIRDVACGRYWKGV